MRISAKGRYALAACIILAKESKSNQVTSVLCISKELDISKIYLEQVFTLLKKGKVVHSIKGASGGYQLTRAIEDISLFDILSPIESGLFEKTKETLEKSDNAIEKTLKKVVYDRIDNELLEFLSTISLKDIYLEYEKNTDQGYMFYI